MGITFFCDSNGVMEIYPYATPYLTFSGWRKQAASQGLENYNHHSKILWGSEGCRVSPRKSKIHFQQFFLHFLISITSKKSWNLTKSCLSYFSICKSNFSKCPFWDMAILVVCWRFLWTNLAKLSPVDFRISLLVDLDDNNGQNKFEVDISQHVAKISNFGPK